MILDCDLVKNTKIHMQSGALSFSFKQSRILQKIMQEMWNACCIFVYQCTLPLLCFRYLCLSLLIVLLEGWYQRANQWHSHNICEGGEHMIWPYWMPPKTPHNTLSVDWIFHSLQMILQLMSNIGFKLKFMATPEH